MYNFFVDENSRQGDCFLIEGADYNHLRNVLRKKPGDTILVSHGGISSLCMLDTLEDGIATAHILEEHFQSTELPVRLYLFQGLPKSDKLELILQKAVELGAAGIIPVEMKRCVMKLDEKKKVTRQTRWQAIAESAAKQSKRNLIPTVSELLPFRQALEQAAKLDLLLLPYENERGMDATRAALNLIQPGMSVGIFIGPEGGFDPREVAQAQELGAHSISLGSRILRTETAAITALAMCMLHVELHTQEDLL